MDLGENYSTAVSSPLSLPTISHLTTPELSDDGLEIEPLPSPLGDNNQNTRIASTSFILVIGGLGYIGSHTVLELLREGYNGKTTYPLPKNNSRLTDIQSSSSITLATATRQS